MRILFIAPNYSPHIGGVERHVREISEELAKDGHAVTILVPKHEAFYPDYESNGNIEVIRFNQPKIRLFASLQRRFQVLAVFNRFFRADVIHFHDFATMWRYGLFIHPLLKALGKKSYITFHGWEGDVPPRKKVIARRKRLEQLTDGNICVGHFIEKWYGTRADVVTYGGVHHFTLPCSAGNHVVFIGRLAADTGIVSYLDAWDRIQREHPSLRFIICGDGVLREELQNVVRERGFTNVEFLGFVETPEYYVQNARIVFTSGYLGIMEAFSCKKPVVAVYDNELKKDYLELIPNSRDMMWIARDGDDVARCVTEALVDVSRAEHAYRYSLDNTWSKVKQDYYRLWGKTSISVAKGKR